MRKFSEERARKEMKVPLFFGGIDPQLEHEGWYLRDHSKVTDHANNFPEPDWKTISHLKPLALDRLCQRILQKAGSILEHAQAGGYQRAYLDLYKYIHTSDETVANCFDDWKRSQAISILVNWRANDLLAEEEFSAFSPETRAMVEVWLKRR